MRRATLAFTRTWVIVADAAQARVYSYAQKNHPWKPLAAGELRQIAAVVEQARARGGFERLVLVAEPQVLGGLLAALSPLAARRVATSIARDYAHAAVEELHDAIVDELPLD
jgi:protein required for attachment to host cells